jgi:hypothetical protein
LFSKGVEAINCHELAECQSRLQDLKFRPNSELLDLDSPAGKASCDKLLQSLATLAPCLGRGHRKHFSSSYKKLMHEPFMADILDAA